VSGYAHVGDAEPSADGAEGETSSYTDAAGFAGAPLRLRWWHLPASEFPVLGLRDAFGAGVVSPTRGDRAGVVPMVLARVELVVGQPTGSASVVRGQIMGVVGRLVGLTYDGQQVRVRIE
jgi:hypothetical protein